MRSPSKRTPHSPPRRGLYDPQYEHDNCGVGFVANINRERTRKVLEYGGEILKNLVHRGAIGGDSKTGDGAGLLFQIPHEFMRKVCATENIPLPDEGQYAVGTFFLPYDDEAARDSAKKIVEEAMSREGLRILGWRRVPTDDSSLGYLARDSQPWVEHLIIASRGLDTETFERRLYLARKVCERVIRELDNPALDTFYVVSLSSRTIIYKGMLAAAQIFDYFPDLKDTDMVSALCVVHQRYSTNTFPTWSLAQPLRYVAHNGEINTLRGNINNMTAREPGMTSDVFGDDIKKLFPIIEPGVSDSACFDNAFELLVQSGRSAPQSLMMMVPEAWGGKYHMSADKRAFYEFYSTIMEPWDGPAAMIFTDGRWIGGTLDRNGLRPCRYTETKDGYVVLASETGVLDIEPSNVRRKGRLQPGKMLLVNTEQGRIVDDNVIKSQISRRKPYRRWLAENRIELRGLFNPAAPVQPDHDTILRRQKTFGYDREELRMILTPMALDGQEAIGSMGDDTPLAALSNRPKLLYNYFKQLFAQVTNPPIDPLREELVMSLRGYIGRSGGLLTEEPSHCRMLMLPHPILTNDDMERIKNADPDLLKTKTLDMTFEVAQGVAGFTQAVERVLGEAAAAVRSGVEIIILSDRAVSRKRAPLPALLATSGVHHRLIQDGLRPLSGLIVETGEAREVMHFALLLGYGASAINPYLAFETLVDMQAVGTIDESVKPEKLVDNFTKAVKKGLLKTFSRMGVSTVRSYRCSQMFEAIGLSSDVVDRFFPWTATRVEGLTFEDIAEDTLRRHRFAFTPQSTPMLDVGGYYHTRSGGEDHLMNAEVIGNLIHAARSGEQSAYDAFASAVDDPTKNSATLRSMWRLRKADTPLSIDQVEPVESILKRFATGAMSYGSISKEAHECLAIAMNRIGGMSNTGEGGEDPERYEPMANGDSKNSFIKQVASGRFGVTIEYLANARELQIKMAQGAKPGEGGQLPGLKVDHAIAKVRHSTPGVSLISPPPHHDIYSIEDLAQLIFDLKNANPKARVSVKLVSEVGVGTIAAGVAKAKADMVLISGHDGGTGASPLTSIKHAGLPWELGVAETQQALVNNHLRDKIRVQTDGQLRTGRDVVIAALLGAEEYGFATVALATMGCCLLRKCHLNSCTMGIATQDTKLRGCFQGDPDHVVNYFRFVAEHTRRLMAEMGFRSIDEMIGRVDMIEVNDSFETGKSRRLDFSKILTPASTDAEQPVRCTVGQGDIEGEILDEELIELARPAIEGGQEVDAEFDIRNSNRATGTMLSYEIAKRHGQSGLPDDTIRLKFNGTTGQSFGAFLARGVTMRLEGDSNDYLGKGLSGGRIIVYPPREATFTPHENIIIGNTVLYGAIDGEVFVRGIAGERFAVRNSGAHAVVEGVGDHGCEYMTGGVVVCLGQTGRNFAAGMSGGVAYVLDENQLFDTRCNLDMVDLEPVVAKEDVAQLKDLVERHARYTDSDSGKRVLGRWDDMLPRFVKVMPIDYREALERMKQNALNFNDTISSTEEVYHHG